MAKFTFKTLTEASTRYQTPNGGEYVFYRNKPTRVEDTEDIKFFDSNPRFNREKRNARSEPQKGADTVLFEELKGVSGVGDATAARIVDQFLTREELAAHLDAGNNLEGVSASVQLNIHKAIANREVDE